MIKLYTVNPAAAMVLGVDAGELFVAHHGASAMTLDNARRGKLHLVPSSWLYPVLVGVGQTVRTKSLASGTERVGVVRKISERRCAGLEMADTPGALWWVTANEIIKIEESN